MKSAAIQRTREQLQAADPRQSVWVLANAGSGKTHVLVERVVRLMLDGAKPDSILCLTFTKAAATEMALRLFDTLSSWIALDEKTLRETLAAMGIVQVTKVELARARQLFATAIETPGGLKIQTIHAFCEKVLQLFPAESGLAPGFRVMDETDKLDLLRQASEAALAEAAAGGDESVMLLEDGGIGSRDDFEELAKRFLSAASVLRDALAADIDPAKVEQGLRQACGIANYESTKEVEREIETIGRAEFADTADALSGVAPFGSHKYDLSAKLRAIAECVDISDLQSALFDFALNKQGEMRGKLFSATTRIDYPDQAAWVERIKLDIVQLLTSHALSRKIDATLALLSLMRRVDRHFSELKAAGGLQDFDDLIVRTKVLLQDSASAKWVLYKLDGNLSHVLVDEAQDTSPAQWEIITALTGEFFAGEGPARREPRTLFVVGDIKQSIYSFQGADTDVFQAARTHFASQLQGVGRELLDVKLRLSFRSLPAILDMVDVVFGPQTTASTGLGPEAGDTKHAPRRTGEGQGIFELWPIVQPLQEEERDYWQAPVDRLSDNAPRKRLARQLAATISGWIGKRQLVSKNRPVEAGDILILLQSRNELFDALIAELRQGGVAVAGADRLKLRENLAVLDLMALAQFCLLPEDDLSLACVLKSPLLPSPLDDAALTSIAATRSASLWSALQEAPGGQENVAWLRECQERARRSGPHGFFAAVLTRFRKAMLARLGEEARDASNTLLDVALDFERDAGTSLAAFLHWFMARDEDVKRELETGGKQLRIMTVHGAKGLESNIVILPDAADMPGPNRGSRLLIAPTGNNVKMDLPFFDVQTEVKPAIIQEWQDEGTLKTRAEKKRLLYVAMTRARDELYVAGSVGRDGHGNPRKVPDESWYGLIEAALADPGLSKCSRPIKDVHPEGVLRRWGADPVTAGPPNANDSTSPPDLLPGWATENVAPAQAAASWSGITALARGQDGIFDRAAAERGIAIHGLLETADSATTREMFRKRAEKRNLEPALAEALFVLIHDKDVGAYFAPASRTEQAIAGHVDGLPPVQGLVDRLLVEPDRVWLMDYKSGRKPTITPPAYLRQMAGYSAVIAEAFPGREIKAALLWTQDGKLEPLDSGTLSRVLETMRVEYSGKAT